MADARYLIVQDGTRWLIKYNDEEYGPYSTETEARLFAIDAAKKLAERGEKAAVYVMGLNGRLRREWIGGQTVAPERSAGPGG
ncbi:MAG TPA: DUF2188 domain-containing protein [Xanthobacteraceae bacterium]|nr:DUF2188 domain-containing protein [Xanthobacteraceae bacterium]